MIDTEDVWALNIAVLAAQILPFYLFTAVLEIVLAGFGALVRAAA